MQSAAEMLQRQDLLSMLLALGSGLQPGKLVSVRMKAAAVALSFLLLIGAMPVALAAKFEGKVARVLDGDTVEVLHDGRPERIRLNGIDSPEKNQAFGQRAKQFTASLCFGKVVKVEDLGRDRYGRTIGEIFANGKDVNHEIVRAGMAWWYRKYAPNDAELKRLETEARGAKRGLWVDAEPMAPWDWRHRKGHDRGFQRYGPSGSL